MALQPYKNYIGGNWCEGQGLIANHSPSDVEDLIGNTTRPAPNRPWTPSRPPVTRNRNGRPAAWNSASTS